MPWALGCPSYLIWPFFLLCILRGCEGELGTLEWGVMLTRLHPQAAKDEASLWANQGPCGSPDHHLLPL